MGQLILELIVYIFLLQACSGNTDLSSQSFPGAFGSTLPVSTSSPTSSSGSSNSGGSNTGNIGSNCYTTSSGGCFSINQMVSTNLSTSQQLRGLAVNGTLIYTLIRNDLGSGIIRWQISSTTLGSTLWTPVCSLLDDGNFNGGLAANSLNFYILGGNESNSATWNYARVFNLNCNEQSSISLGENFSRGDDKNNGNYTGQYGALTELSIVGNSIFYDKQWSAGYRKFNSNSSTYEQLFTSSQLGGYTFTWNQFDTPVNTQTIKTASASNLWGIQIPSGVLWKFQSDGTPLCWGQLPNSNYPFLNGTYITQIAQFDTNTLILISNDRSGLFRMYFLDVSKF